MYKAMILTPWTGSGADEDPNRPLLADDYNLDSWSDATGQPEANIPTNPNLLQVEAILSAETLEEIEADNTYQVLWSFDLGD